MRSASVLALVLCGSSSIAQSFVDEALRPYSRTSPDGRWKLEVVPSQPDGSGGATCRLTRETAAIWSGWKTWTFRDALVTDEGFVAGYSYSEDGVRDLAGGDFHAVILAPDGGVKLDEKHARTSGYSPHSSSNPFALGLFGRPSAKQIVFRIADPDVNRRREEWWCFQLPDAREVYRKRPAEIAPDVGDSIFDVAEVPGTPLIAVQWRTMDFPRVGFGWVLHDEDLRAVWESGPLEMYGGRPFAAERDALQAIQARGNLVVGPAAGEVRYRRSDTKATTRFSVERTPDGWRVTEVDPDRARSSARSASFLELPVAELELNASSALQEPLANRAPTPDIAAFDPGGDRSVRLARRSAAGDIELSTIDEDGRRLFGRRVAMPDVAAESNPELRPLGPDAWILTAHEGPTMTAWRIDEEPGTATRLLAFDAPSVKALAAFRDERFVVLATEASGKKSVIGFDREGRRLWRVESDSGSPASSSLSDPVDVAVTRDRRVAVLDASRRTLQLFERDGKFRRAFPLDEATAGRDLASAKLTADRDDGFLLHEGSLPRLRRLTKNVRLRSEMSPAFEGGAAADVLARNARTASDGRIWSHDGRRIVRLDDQGLVDRIVPSVVDSDALQQPCAATVDVYGRALIQDRATGAVHVFDGRGTRLFTCWVDARDGNDASAIVHLAATRERGVLVHSWTDLWVRFAPDGRRIDRLCVEGVDRTLVQSPVAEDSYGGTVRGGFRRLGADWKTRAKFTGAPDGRPLVGADDPAIAPDGAVCVVSGGDTLVVFAPRKLDAGRSFALPRGAPTFRVTAGRKWVALAGFDEQVLLVERAGDRMLRFRAPGAGQLKQSWRFGFDPDTDELVALDLGGRRILRYALP